MKYIHRYNYLHNLNQQKWKPLSQYKINSKTVSFSSLNQGRAKRLDLDKVRHLFS